MTFLLSSHNVFDYLSARGLCQETDRDRVDIEPKTAKNFNLLVNLPNRGKLLVKQERVNTTGKMAGEFSREWRFHQSIARFSELNHLRSLVSEVRHFNEVDSIIVFNYLDNYSDLADFYRKNKSFPTEIAGAIGATLASIHQATFKHHAYEDFFAQNCRDRFLDRPAYLTLALDRLSPEIFGQIPADAIKFFVLYQRYSSLGNAISELIATAKPTCLIHNDLKLNNILLDRDWKQVSDKIPSLSNNLHDKNGAIRFIDWERSTWGDPAYDLGSAIASYLSIWLSSLVVSKSMEIEESLRLAAIPLEQLQPSVAALTETYIDRFPKIIEHHPDFLKRIIQFAGLALIEQIQASIQYQKSFSNAGICTLQVAKSLLCRPEQSIPTIFGESASKLSQFNFIPT